MSIKYNGFNISVVFWRLVLFYKSAFRVFCDVPGVAFIREDRMLKLVA